MTSLASARDKPDRCPFCGQPLSSPAPKRCPMCFHPLGDEAPTGLDVTPYALGYENGTQSWWRMAVWIWSANAERIKHLALMRASEASSRFAWSFLLLFCGVLGLFQVSRVGWRLSASTVHPAGEGWFRIVSSPTSAPVDPSLSVVRSELWWNPAQAVLAWMGGAAVGLLLVALWFRLIRAGFMLAHTPRYREHRPMSAALQYGLSWFVALLIAAVIMAFMPITYLRTTGVCPWCPTARFLVIPAGVLTAFGTAMWWFFLVRIGSTAPARTRGRVVGFVVVGLPLMTLLAAAAWWYGLGAVWPRLFPQLGIAF